MSKAPASETTPTNLSQDDKGELPWVVDLGYRQVYLREMPFFTQYK
jgi:hypothetical protein